MENEKFTKEEIEYLTSLDAVIEVHKNQILYSNEFKKSYVERYKNGEKPGKIFADAGLTRQIIGSKRIERASSRWLQADAKGMLGETQAAPIRHRNKIEELKQEKAEAVEKQRQIRKKEIAKFEKKIDRYKQTISKKNEKIITLQKIIEVQKSKIKSLKAIH